MRSPTRTEGRSPEFDLDAEEIVTAAVEIFEESGLDAVSMRSVSARLGVSPVPLYSRVGNKDALLDAIAERLLADLAPPADDGEPWDEYALRWARELRVGRVERGDSRLLLWPGRDAYVEASRPLVDSMRRDGFEADAAVQACRLLTWATVGFGAIESGIEPPRRGRRATRPGGDPGGVTPADAETLFDLHIRYLIEGIARDARARGAPEDEAMTIPTLDATGKVVVVTGGSKGLGRAMALGFAEAGADVVVASRKLEPCEAVAAEIRARGRRALAVSCHVGDWDQCATLIDATVAEFGRIDVLVNNAGIAPVPPSLAGITSDLFDKTIGVNLKGPLRLTALAAEHMTAGGSIINISSKASLHPTSYTVVYAAAKAGLNALTKAAAQEFGPRGIRVNAIVCGTFHTDSLHASIPTEEMQAAMATNVSLGRIADADEIVGTALFLASDASSYLSGELISLDGG